MVGASSEFSAPSQPQVRGDGLADQDRHRPPISLGVLGGTRRATGEYVGGAAAPGN